MDKIYTFTEVSGVRFKMVYPVSVFLKAIHVETDPQMISAYLIYLSQHAPVEEQASHNDLALVIIENCFS